MNQPEPSTPSEEEPQPLISKELLRKVGMCIGGLGFLTVILSLGGRMIGEQIVMSGHSVDTTPVSITVNGNAIALPANAIRFEEQREGGTHERVDAYFTWPELEGYTHENRKHFNDIGSSQNLVFLTLSARTMPMDMSARLQPVYSRLTEGGQQSKQSGLLAYAFDEDTRYAGEILYVGARDGEPAFAVRCLRDDSMPTGSHSCLRDINVGRDLSVTYRFSRRLLPDWRRLDAAVLAYIMDAFEASENDSTS